MQILEDAKNGNDAAEFPALAASFPASQIPNVSEGDKSMTEITTTKAQPATLTERELFARFQKMSVSQTIGNGVPIRTYTPEDELRNCGMYGQLEDAADRETDELAESSTPLEDLEILAGEYEGRAHWLRKVADDFKSFADHSRIEIGDEPDPASAEYPAWDAARMEDEKNPRYAAPPTSADEDDFNGVDFIEDGSKPAPEHDDSGFISEEEDSGFGAPPDGVMTEAAVMEWIGKNLEKLDEPLPKSL